MLDLEAIELIKQLKARYFRFLDSGDLDALKTVFTDDIVVDFKSPTYHINYTGWPELRAFYEQAFTRTKFGMHHGHHPEISVDGDKATGIWYLHDIFMNTEDRRQYEGSAIYEDRYVKVDGQWLIAHSGYNRYLEIIRPIDDSVEITAVPVR